MQAYQIIIVPCKKMKRFFGAFFFAKKLHILIYRFSQKMSHPKTESTLSNKLGHYRLRKISTPIFLSQERTMQLHFWSIFFVFSRHLGSLLDCPLFRHCHNIVVTTIVTILSWQYFDNIMTIRQCKKFFNFLKKWWIFILYGTYRN